MRKTDKTKKVYFFSFVGSNYSRSSTLLNFFENKTSKEYIHFESGVFPMIAKIRSMRSKLSKHDHVLIMSPCHKMAIFVRLLTRSQIILDAGWPLTDGQLSRKLTLLTLLRLPKIFLVDLTAFRCANLILVESETQKNRVIKLFKINPNRVKVSFTGLNETRFNSIKTISPSMHKVSDFISSWESELIVLFRGKINPESGIEIILKAAEYLGGKCKFILQIGNSKISNNYSSNCLIVNEVSDQQLTELYSVSDIVLGQLSNHPRLRYTIPHKAYEAAFFGKCFITTKSEGILEIMDDNCALLIEDPTPETLAESILTLKSESKRSSYASNLAQQYQKYLSQKEINARFQSFLQEF